jgi:integrase
VNAKKNGVKELNHFQPYVLRHTALTRLAEAGCDVFTLARIAGHSSITITHRYVHPQADAIERAFQQMTKAALAALPATGEPVQPKT